MTEIPPPPPPPPAMMPPSGAYGPPPGKGLAITSMVLGIVSIAVCCYWFISGPLAIAALVLGIVARNKGAANGMSLTGIITGAIGTLLAVVSLILMLTGNGLDAYCVSNPDNPICEAQY